MSNEKHQEQLLSYLKERADESAFVSFLSKIKIKKVEEKLIYFTVPSEFIKEYIETNYFFDLIYAIRNTFNRELQIRIEALAKTESIDRQMNIMVRNAEENVIDRSSLNDKYIFDNFVVGNSNRLAYASSMAVAKHPAETYNPLFIYGKSGLGKTHLLNAIGNYVKQIDPKKKVYYVSTEKFLNDYIHAIQENKTTEFRHKYRQLDLLLLDDVHFLKEKEGTQEEIFHTFNALYESNSQIVITADRLPHEIPKLQQRLVTRFQMGLIVDIQPPDFETRLAILKKKVKDSNIDISDEILSYIANNIKDNVRLLEGSLISIFARASLTRSQINIQFVRDVITHLISDINERNVSIHSISTEDIIKVVCDYFKVTESQLKGKKRDASIVLPRHIAIYLIKKYTNLSLKEIAKHVGKKDHSTIIHSISKIEKQIKIDQNLSTDVMNIISLLNVD